AEFCECRLMEHLQATPHPGGNAAPRDLRGPRKKVPLEELDADGLGKGKLFRTFDLFRQQLDSATSETLHRLRQLTPREVRPVEFDVMSIPEQFRAGIVRSPIIQRHAESARSKLLDATNDFGIDGDGLQELDHAAIRWKLIRQSRRHILGV